MKRLQKVKYKAVKLILPKNDHIDARFYGTICAFPMSYSVGKSIIEFCAKKKIEPGKSHILIVGAHGGRDYHWLTGFGHTVDILDIGHNSWRASEYVGDVCKSETWNSISKRYDLILLHDVLEHLPEDYAALQYAKSVIKNDGYLFLSVPYRHDEEVTHVRSYSKATFKRLLTIAGYEMVWKQDRPGLLEAFPRFVNAFNYGLALLMPTVRLGAALLVRLLKTEYYVNEKTRTLYRVFGRSPQKGITLAAKLLKQEDVQDYLELNKKMFLS